MELPEINSINIKSYFVLKINDKYIISSPFTKITDFCFSSNLIEVPDNLLCKSWNEATELRLDYYRFHRLLQNTRIEIVPVRKVE